jgi:hypothetical protein
MFTYDLAEIAAEFPGIGNFRFLDVIATGAYVAADTDQSGERAASLESPDEVG